MYLKHRLGAGVIFTLFFVLFITAEARNPAITQDNETNLNSYSCTSIVVSRGASVDGSVMTTHSCDGPYEVRLHVVPGKAHASGEMRPIFKGGGLGAEMKAAIQSGEIPEVSTTYSRFDIAYPFMNEKQVAIGETTIGGRRELYNSEGLFDIMALERVALERAASAREAIEIMGELAVRYGYSDGGECLTVCDSKEAWVFEIFGAGPLETGAVWAARRVPDGEVSVSANHSRIAEIDLKNKENFLASENVVEVAVEMGWYDPDSGHPFIFNEAYSPYELGYLMYTRRREWRVLSTLAPGMKLDPWCETGYPFSVKPEKKVSVKTLMTLHRDYYQDSPFDMGQGLAAGPFKTPNRYNVAQGTLKKGFLGWERPIAYNKCSYSFVSQSRDWLPDWIGGLIWFGEDDPKTTCYVPFYCGVTTTPACFQTGRKDVYDRAAAWWAFNFVGNWADLKYMYMIKDIRSLQSELEEELFGLQPAVEATALKLYADDPAACRNYLTHYSNSMARGVVESWWALADHLIVKYSDGLVNVDGENRRVGYPKEWLDAVGYGQTPIRKAGKK